MYLFLKKKTNDLEIMKLIDIPAFSYFIFYSKRKLTNGKLDECNNFLNIFILACLMAYQLVWFGIFV